MSDENSLRQPGAYVNPGGILRRFGRRAKTSLAVVGGLTVGLGLAASLTSVGASNANKKAVKLPDEFLLEIDLENLELVETSPFNPLQFLGQATRKLQIRDLVKALSNASGDERLKGIVAHIGDANASCGLALAEEARRAVLDFRKKNHNQAATVAFSTSFGESGSQGFATYFLASAFEKVYMQPTGLLSLTGLSVEQPFIKKFLDRWKVRPYVSSREEFKGIVEGVTRDEFSAPARLALKEMLTSMSRTVIQGIADSRMMLTPDVLSALNDAPLSAPNALSLRLLDGLKYRDEAMLVAWGYVPPADVDPPAGATELVMTPSPAGSVHTAKETRASAPRSMKVVSLERYLRSIKGKEAVEEGAKQPGALSTVLRQLREDDKDKTSGPEVALVIAEGQIVQGNGQQSGSQQQISSGKLCAQLRQLREKASVKAVVLRVNSPGGSALASDSIHREVKALRDAGKPVAISMGNVAASGGYYISAPASIIFAQRTTITGSIGVAFAKFNIGPALKEAGISTDRVACGPNASALSPFTDFSKEQEAAVEKQIDTIYDEFLRRVAEGRGLTADATRKVAKGRVWSGADAVRLGLADRLGGLQEATEWALAATTSDEGTKPKVVTYPKPLSTADILRKLRDQEPFELTSASSPLSSKLLAMLAAQVIGSATPTGGLAAASGLATSCAKEAGMTEGFQLLCDITVS